MAEEQVKILKRIDFKLDQLLKWTKMAGIQQLRSILSQTLNDDTAALVFELSDGKRGTRDIAKAAGLKSNATVVNYWKKWRKLGIIEESSAYPGRYVRICSLEEVGLTVPPFPKTLGNELQEAQGDEID